MTRKEERRYTAEELAEKYQGSKAKFEPRYGEGKLETYLAASTDQAVADYYNDLLNEQVEPVGRGAPNPRIDLKAVRHGCYRNGRGSDTSVKESFVEAMVRDGYLIPRTTPLEKQWQKRREAHLAEQANQTDSPSQTPQGRGGRG